MTVIVSTRFRRPKIVRISMALNQVSSWLAQRQFHFRCYICNALCEICYLQITEFSYSGSGRCGRRANIHPGPGKCYIDFLQEDGSLPKKPGFSAPILARFLDWRLPLTSGAGVVASGRGAFNRVIVSKKAGEIMRRAWSKSCALSHFTFCDLDGDKKRPAVEPRA